MRRLLPIALVLILTACSAPTPTAALPAPTQPARPTATADSAAVETAAVDEPAPAATAELTATSEPSPTAPAAEPVPPDTDPALLGAAWEWSAAEIPGCDLLIFQPDGSLALQAGCAAGQGSYQVSGSNLTLTLPGEVEGDLPARLAGVTTYAVRAGTLVLTTASGAEESFRAPPIGPGPAARGGLRRGDIEI